MLTAQTVKHLGSEEVKNNFEHVSLDSAPGEKKKNPSGGYSTPKYYGLKTNVFLRHDALCSTFQQEKYITLVTNLPKINRKAVAVP